MGVARKGMQNEDGIVVGGAEFAIGLVGQGYRAQPAAAVKLQALTVIGKGIIFLPVSSTPFSF